jgi:predicted transcriptional regulator
MGCTNSTKKEETDIEKRQINEHGFKNLFHTTTEFDLSASDSETEDEILSIESINNNNNKLHLTKKTDEISSELTTANINSTTSSTLLNNRLIQTRV